MKIRSKNGIDLENLCTIMEERMVKKVYNDIFDNTKKKGKWIDFIYCPVAQTPLLPPSHLELFLCLFYIYENRMYIHQKYVCITLFGKVYRTIFQSERRRLVIRTGVITYVHSKLYFLKLLKNILKYLFTYIHIWY